MFCVSIGALKKTALQTGGQCKTGKDFELVKYFGNLFANNK